MRRRQAAATLLSLSGLRWWPFIFLAGAGAVVFLSGGRQGPVTGPLTMVWAFALMMGLALAVFLEVAARACVARQSLAGGFDASPEGARAVLDATAVLTRVVSLAISVFMSLLVVSQTWLPGFGQQRALGLARIIRELPPHPHPAPLPPEGEGAMSRSLAPRGGEGRVRGSPRRDHRVHE